MVINRKYLITWVILTLFFSGLGLVFAFASRQTILVGFLVYLPLTGGIVWLTIYRRKAWLGLWFLVYLSWLTYIGPYVAAVFNNLPIGDTFQYWSKLLLTDSLFANCFSLSVPP